MLPPSIVMSPLRSSAPPLPPVPLSLPLPPPPMPAAKPLEPVLGNLVPAVMLPPLMVMLLVLSPSLFQPPLPPMPAPYPPPVTVSLPTSSTSPPVLPSAEAAHSAFFSSSDFTVLPSFLMSSLMVSLPFESLSFFSKPAWLLSSSLLEPLVNLLSPSSSISTSPSPLIFMAASVLDLTLASFRVMSALPPSSTSTVMVLEVSSPSLVMVTLPSSSFFSLFSPCFT